MYPLRNDVDLKLIMKKLGHEVEEIRVRTLRNLLSKLELKLLFEEDFTQEQALFSRLLGWFNFTPCPMQGEVLQLIKTLSQHSSACELLVRIGGVEFLSELRPDCDEDLQPLVDDILENLFKLPEPDERSSHLVVQPRFSEECHYHHKTTENSDHARELERLQDPLFDSPQSYFPVGHKQRGTSQELAQRLSPTPERMRGVLFSTFPWLMLTPTDKHVLTSTNNSLTGPKQDVMKTSCDFFCDVVLQDFPAEIFLQRPHIVKSLLLILTLRPPHLEDQSLILRAIRCLADLCQFLCERYYFYHDPDLYCPKQAFGGSQMSAGSSSPGLPSQSTSQSNLSINSRPSVIGHEGPRVGGDGRDWDSPTSGLAGRSSSHWSSSGVESEDAVGLQFSQVTLPQFCVDVLHRAVGVCQDFTSPDVLSKTVQLLWGVIKLMQLCLSPEIWSETGLSGRALTDKLSESLEILADILLQGNHQLQQTPERSEVIQISLVHISMAAVTTKLITSLIPLPMASTILSESLSSCLCHLITNPFINICLPEVRGQLIPYLKESNNQLLREYEDCQVICDAVTKAAEFLSSEGLNASSSHVMVEISLPGLIFKDTFPVVNEFVTLFSSQAATSDGIDHEGSGRVLSCLLDHPSVHHLTVAACCSIVEDALNVSQSADPSCRASRNVLFLLQPSILKSFADHISSKDQKLSDTAVSVILHLLTGKLLMQPGVWGKFIEVCHPSLAIIQAHAPKNPAVGHALGALLVENVATTPDTLPYLQRLRLAIRFLFLKDNRERKEVARFIVKYLLNEGGSEGLLPHRAILIPEQISLLLMFDKPHPLEEDIGRSVFEALPLELDNDEDDRMKVGCGEGLLPHRAVQIAEQISLLLMFDRPHPLEDDIRRSVSEVDSLVQMFGIFRSPDTEDSLRKSSADQLAIILQDHSLHQAFLSQSGHEVVLKMLRTGLEKRRQPHMSPELLASCGRILHLLVHHNPTLRHDLAGEISVYLTLLRCALVCQRDDKARHDFCHLLALLVLDETAGVMSSEDGQEMKFCLPPAVLSGYQLPFSCPTLERSPTGHPQLPRDDPLPLQAVKVSWAIAANQGCDRLVKNLMAGVADKESLDLGLSDTEKILMMYSYPPSAVKLTVKGIKTATSHYGVKQSLWQLPHWLALERSISEGEEVNGGLQERGICLSMMQEDLVGTLGRFLDVPPSNPDDKLLLQEVFCFLTLFLKSSPDQSRLLVESLKHQIGAGSPMLELLGQSAEVKPLVEGAAEPDKKSDLLKQVLSFMSVFVQKLQLSSEAWMLNGHFVGSSLVTKLLEGLHLADEFHYYDLPSLEATLRCLMHVTARPGWSLDWSGGDSFTLCQQMLHSLLEVVSAFHIGRGGIAISFMGKGVTRNATLCLLHLSHEMRLRAPDQTWPSEWLHEVPESTPAGLQWIVPLWSYRDPEVRASGLGIAVSLASTLPGCQYLSRCYDGLPGTLWTTLLTIITDHSECSVVRRQAINLLINLLSHPITEPEEGKAPEGDEWVGPKLTNQDTQVSISGTAALLALLNYFHFIPNVITLLSYFYPQCTIQPVSVVENSSAGSSRSVSGPSTATTPDIADQTSLRHSSQRSTTNQVVSPVLSEQSSTVPLITPSFHADGLPSSSLSSEDTVVEPRSGRAPSTVGYLSVVTPSLVASVCMVLRQLIILLPEKTILSEGKEEIMKRITGIIDTNKAQCLVQKPPVLASAQYMNMCSKTLQLTAVWMDGELDVTKLLSKTCQLLHIPIHNNADQVVQAAQLELIESCYNLMSASIKCGKHKIVLEVAAHHWTGITDMVVSLLRFSTPCTSRTAAFIFLGQALSWEPGPMGLSPLQDAMEAIDRDDATPGSLLCEALLSVYDGTAGPCLSHSAQERAALVAALRNLLAHSESAKQTALGAGFVESLVEDMKGCHSKLTNESLNKKKNKKKESSLLKQIKTCLELLQNLMYGSGDIKVAASQAGLAIVLHKSWGWIVSIKALLSAALASLTVYTAHCHKASLSLTRSPAGQNTNTLLHHLIRLAEKPNPDRRVFEVITNCLWSEECRSIISKCGFLSNLNKFQSLSSKSSKSPQQIQAITLWLKLLVVFTFSPDGQQMAMKVKDVLDLLIELATWPNPDIGPLATIVLHNLCFLGANKNKLLSNELLIPVFLDKFDNGDLREQFTVTSALWSGLHGNQKVKTLMKAHNLELRTRDKLSDVHRELQMPLTDSAVRDLLIKQQSALTCLLRVLGD